VICKLLERPINDQMVEFSCWKWLDTYLNVGI